VVLTEAQAATMMRRDVSGERQRSEFDTGVEESKRELESEGRRCGSDRGSLGVYIWGRGSTGEEVTTGNRWCYGINTIEDQGWLRRGVNSGESRQGS
jgi:hypothetical protein